MGDVETICLRMNGPLMGMSMEPAEGDKEEKRKIEYTLFIMPLRMNGK